MDPDNLEQKIMHRLASYDISKPTEVILSFDESDGEQSPNTDFDENTTNNHLSKDIKKPANDYAACKVVVNNDLPKTNTDMGLKNLDVNLISLSKKPTSDVIFSSGPPGQQVSITIDHSVLRQQLQQTNVNFTPYHTAKSTIIQKPSNFLQQLETYVQSSSQNWHQVQLPKQQLSQQQLPQQKLPQHQLPQQQSPRQKLPQQQSPQQQLPQQQLAQQQFLQRQLPQQQFIQQQVPPQHLPLQPMAQQHLLRNHTTNQGNQVPHSNDPKTVFFTQLQQAHSDYPQNALLQNKRPPPSYRQHQSHMVPTSTHQHPNIFPHPLHPYRTLEQNEPRAQPEIIRSSSNDSGFTSPLNFNSPAPTSIQGDLQDDSGPLITHVTSYNPEAISISQGVCHVCGKYTKLKCRGCFQRYYCTSACQHIDWFLHQEDCKK
ncbi:integrator complex subunit 3 homolog isoform X2 [Hyposmocoma kahamanoa]|uniref:integrator complex subunit 3 homolog isoform X2 n=1 Tax=Hyposmocoma kahamanoa TaxID=1477025 RepID=UPI000E6D6EFC|nr:integrator complex subunit 3 homolog isoform X2 [Hyposmocoma kahamanoa]